MAGSLNISTEPQAWRSAEDLTSYVGSEVENYGEVVVTDDKNICAAGYASYCLTPDGKLTLCPSFLSVIGDLKMSSFIDVLNSPHLAFWKKTKHINHASTLPWIFFSSRVRVLSFLMSSCISALVINVAPLSLHIYEKLLKIWDLEQIYFFRGLFLLLSVVGEVGRKFEHTHADFWRHLIWIPDKMTTLRKILRFQ